MSEIRKLFEATKPFREEIAKLQAEVELCHKNLKMFRDSLVNVGEQRDAAKEIAESAKLQNDDLRGEIVKVKTMCAEWENRTLNPSQVESIWGICHNALTMHKTNEECMCTGEPPAGCVSTNCRADKKRPSNETSTSEYSSARARLQRGECSRCGSPGCCECT